MIRKTVVPFLLLLSSLYLTGCVTSGFYLDDVNRSMGDIRTAVKNVYGIQSMNHNQRILITPPLKKNLNDPTPIKDLRERVYARIVIVGDQRPYRVLVEVYEENKVENDWVELDVDEGLSKEFARELNLELIESRDKRNVIDDFRAF